MNTNLQKIMITDFKHINLISVFDLFKPIKAQLAMQLELKYFYEKYKDSHYHINELLKLGNEINLCLLENELEKLQLFIAKNKTKINNFNPIGFLECDLRDFEYLYNKLETIEERILWMSDKNNELSLQLLKHKMITKENLHLNYYYLIEDVCCDLLLVIKSSKASKSICNMELIGKCNNNDAQSNKEEAQADKYVIDDNDPIDHVIIRDIYNKFNDIIFKAVEEKNVYNIFNLKKDDGFYVPKNKKMKFYSLVKHIYDISQNNNENRVKTLTWEKKIIEFLGYEYGDYQKSKHHAKSYIQKIRV